jgi:hypothetical protein
MVPRVARAEYVDGFVIRVTFSDGVAGEIDFRDELEGEVFDPLRDPRYFRRFRLDNELHTLAWPNGADFAPEFLYERVKARE